MIGDFADADDDGDAVVGDRGVHVRHFALFRYQRIHVLDRVGKIFLEFLHHRTGGFDAVD